MFSELTLHSHTLELFPPFPGDQVTAPRKEITGNNIFLTFGLHVPALQCQAPYCAGRSSLTFTAVGHTKRSGEWPEGVMGTYWPQRTVMSEAQPLLVNFLLNKRCFLSCENTRIESAIGDLPGRRAQPQNTEIHLWGSVGGWCAECSWPLQEFEIIASPILNLNISSSEKIFFKYKITILTM